MIKLLQIILKFYSLFKLFQYHNFILLVIGQIISSSIFSKILPWSFKSIHRNEVFLYQLQIRFFFLFSIIAETATNPLPIVTFGISFLENLNKIVSVDIKKIVRDTAAIKKMGHLHCDIYQNSKIC